MLPEKFGKINVLTKRVINHAKKRHKPLYAWLYEGDIVKTVNTKRNHDRLMQIGVNGVFTDYPQKLANELQ